MTEPSYQKIMGEVREFYYDTLNDLYVLRDSRGYDYDDRDFKSAVETFFGDGFYELYASWERNND